MKMKYSKASNVECFKFCIFAVYSYFILLFLYSPWFLSSVDRWLWNISHYLILWFNVYTTKSETECLYLIVSTLSLILCCVTNEQVQINVVVLRFYFIWAVLLEMWCHNGSDFVWEKLFQHFVCSLTIMIQ